MFKTATYFKALGLLLCVVTGSTALAQYPDKPIRFIVPYAAGSSPDAICRLIGAELSRQIGKQFVIDNKPGASAMIGTELAARAAPDGYTIVYANVGTLAINPSLFSKLPYHPEKDFAPIGLLGFVQNGLVVRNDLPVKSVNELIAYAKKNPGKLSMASSGNGTTGHLGGELFKSMTGTFMTHIPYTGSGPALLGLLSGQVDVMFDNLPSALPHVRGGKLKAFAVTSAQRSGATPELPTIEEAGQLKGFEASSWFGLLAPAGTPPDVVSRIQQETGKALNSPAIKEKLLAQGAIPSGNTPVEFTRFIDAEIRKWAPVVKASGAKVD